jgi:hypothetical protein
VIKMAKKKENVTINIKKKYLIIAGVIISVVVLLFLFNSMNIPQERFCDDVEEVMKNCGLFNTSCTLKGMEKFEKKYDLSEDETLLKLLECIEELDLEDEGWY